MGASSYGLGWVKVRWDHNAKCHRYRVGAEGKYDLMVARSQDLQDARRSSPSIIQVEAEPECAAAESGSPEKLDADAGHDEQWLDAAEANGLLCSICLCVARDAMAHDCGNLFCQICWNRWVLKDPTCPVCREDSSSVVRAPRDQRKILNLMLRCPLQCGEDVRLGDKQRHFSELCLKRKVRCSQCGLRILAETVSIHQKEECNSRPVMCEMCGQIVAMDKLEIHMVEDAKSHILPLLKENQSLRRRVDELEKLIQVRPQEFQ